MKLETQLRQAEAYSRSGFRVVLFFLTVCIGSFVFDVIWLSKLSLLFMLFFSGTTALEYVNYRGLLKDKKEKDTLP